MKVIRRSPVDMENPTCVLGFSQISTDSLHTIYKTFTHPNWCRMSYTWSHTLHKLMSPRWTIPSLKIPLSSSSTPKNWTFLLSWRSWYWQLFTRFLLGIDLHDARPLGIGLRRSYNWSPAQRVVDWKCVSDSCSLACFSLDPLQTLNFHCRIGPKILLLTKRHQRLKARIQELNWVMSDTEDPNATSASLCNKTCCDDEFCSVWQFMRPHWLRLVDVFVCCFLQLNF